MKKSAIIIGTLFYGLRCSVNTCDNAFALVVITSDVYVDEVKGSTHVLVRCDAHGCIFLPTELKFIDKIEFLVPLKLIKALIKRVSTAKYSQFSR
jgi:hypothetical protein